MRRDLALFFLEQFKDYLLVPGMPMNEQTFGAIARSVLLMADGFENMEALTKEQLLTWGQPQSPMRAPPPQPSVQPNLQAVPAPQAS